MNKLVYTSKEVEDKILEGVRLITDPIKQTMSPMGGNVLYEDGKGKQNHTNDGVTIAKNIYVKDPIVNQTIDVIRDASLQTNKEAGDGTSSTVLLSSVLIEDGIKLIRNGWNPVNIKREYEKFGEMLIKEIKKSAVEVNTEDDILKLARVSTSNDEEIAKNTARIIEVAGKEGQVMLNGGYSEETELIEDVGFILKNGVFTPELVSEKNRFSVQYNDTLVLVTDKRLYYQAEAEEILNTARMSGYKDIVIIAADFIGEALPTFTENHRQGVMNILLVKETDTELLSDLAVYLGGEVISDKSGSLDNLSIGDYMVAKMIFADPKKTIISRDKDEVNPALNQLIKAIKKEMKKVGNKSSAEYLKFESRLASLTRGMVTVKVGGRTPIEIQEKVFRYEDAINAVRVAMIDGYVVGGGLSLVNALKNINIKKFDSEMQRVFERFTTAIFRQISNNCGINPDVNMSKLEAIQAENGSEWGYNAVTGEMSNLLEDGVIEPFTVSKQSINNAISVANIILTSQYRIVNDIEEDNN